MYFHVAVHEAPLKGVTLIRVEHAGQLGRPDPSPACFQTISFGRRRPVLLVIT